MTFDPTYKYDKGCDVYDTSKKDRSPAWCDRILFYRNPQFKDQMIEDPYKGDDVQAAMPVYYNRKMSYLADHRPVLAIYSLPIVKIDLDLKEKLKSEILTSISTGHEDQPLIITKDSLRTKSL